MLSLLSLLGVGFLLGLRHATDADHVVAVSTIVARERRVGAAAALGALWGVGHTLMVMLVGIALVLFGIVIPATVGMGMEIAVGVMLVALGVWALGSIERKTHSEEPSHTPAARLDGKPAQRSLTRWLRPMAIGVVHGLAGSAPVVLLVMAATRDVGAAFMYLLTFGLGTVLGMMSLTTVMAAPLALGARRLPHFGGQVRLVSGAASVALGLWLIVR
jgi:cytochrome c biogenesis protein CcdA